MHVSVEREKKFVILAPQVQFEIIVNTFKCLPEFLLLSEWKVLVVYLVAPKT